MKRKTTDNAAKASGFYINELIQGFMGEQGEGKRMLRLMGLPAEAPPFSAATLLRKKRAGWTDKDGNAASISFRLKPDQLECFGSYLGKKRSIRVFREWGSREDPDTVTKLESQAIGDLCMRCIYDNLTE